MSADSGSTPDVARAYAAAERGDVGALDAARAALEGASTETARAWSAALAALRSLIDPRVAAPVAITPEAVASYVGGSPDARSIAARGCATMELASTIAFDRPALEAWLRVHERLCEDGGDDEAVLRRDTARAWRALLDGEHGEVEAAGPGLYARASRLGVASAVVQVTVLRALAALARQETATAIELARRAARMAQAEALPQEEYLAHLALARIRRHGGRPYHAAHILVALARVAPPAWHGWLAWELLLAGGERRAADLLGHGDGDGGGTVAARAARALAALVEAARSGDRHAFAAAADTVAAAAAGWRGVLTEVEALVSTIDHVRDNAPDIVQLWRQGQVAQVPVGLHGLGAPPALDPESDITVGYVVALPGRAGRRVLPPGLGLAPAARRLDVERTAPGGGGRADIGLAVLALAGPAGLPRREFFQSVYGFTFSPRVHQDALDVLVHRMRQRLGDAGEIARGGDDLVIALSLSAPLVVPDARCAVPTAERVLRALALLSRASAQEAAQLLGVAVRTVQKALQELVADGSCASERIGNRVAYRLHDTTFTEVTYLEARPR